LNHPKNPHRSRKEEETKEERRRDDAEGRIRA